MHVKGKRDSVVVASFWESLYADPPPKWIQQQQLGCQSCDGGRRQLARVECAFLLSPSLRKMLLLLLLTLAPPFCQVLQKTLNREREGCNLQKKPLKRYDPPRRPQRLFLNQICFPFHLLFAHRNKKLSQKLCVHFCC